MKELKQFLCLQRLTKQIIAIIMILALVNSNVFAMFGEQQKISGKVVNTAGEPVIGATVVIKGTSKGVLTDSGGKFSIESNSAKDIILVSFIGMKNNEVIVGNKTYIEIILEQSIVQLDEVVAVGYMTQKKADLTGSVSIVSNKEISKNSYSNVLKSIQGKVPGVYIVTDGDVTSAVDIQIRGLTSINPSQPLIVIDGVASTINLSSINPKDIQSIQVLKDAASASIYGARAAGGVILITTLQAKKGDLNISYDVKTSFSKILNKPDLCNTLEYGAAHFWGYVNDGLDPNAQTQVYKYDWHRDDNGNAVLDKVNPVEWLNIAHTQKSADTDWWDEVFKTSFTQDHQLTVLNGSDKTKVLFSMNYLHDNGTMIDTYLKRFTARLNTSFNLIDDRLTIGENLSISNSKYRGNYYSPWNYVNDVLVMPSIVPVHDINGGWGGVATELGMLTGSINIVHALEAGKDDATKDLTALGSIFADMKIVKGLHLKTQFGIDYSNSFNRFLSRKWIEAGSAPGVVNSVSVNSNYTTSWVWTNTLNYSLSTGNHNLDFLTGMELYHYNYEYLNGNRENILLENYDFAYINTATGLFTVNNFGDENSLVSYFSKVNYSFKNRYLISLTGRFDGSSKFPEANKYGFFPAVSLGWRVSEENFMDILPMLSDLKLRASWGVNGNSNIPSNGVLTLFDNDYGTTSYEINGAPTGIAPFGYRATHTGNPNLKWESTSQINIGVDFGILHDRLVGSLDVYKKVTTGMLWEPSTNPLIGEGGKMWINAANMTNVGFEAVVTYKSSAERDFVYSISGNMSLYRNRIDDIPKGLELQYGGNGMGENILGHPLRSLYGFVADGIFKTQEEVDNAPEQTGKGLGRIKWKDLDHDGRITYEYDQTWIANYDPDFMYGIDFNAQYKNFDFSMFWQGLVGNDVYNDWLYQADFLNLLIWPGYNHTSEILNAWTPNNMDSNKPALTWLNSNQENRNSTYYIQNGSYLKLRNIELGYKLPDAIGNKMHMKNFRIYVSAQNLISLKKWWGKDAFTGWDPEVNKHTIYYDSAYGFVSQYNQSYTRPTIITIGINSTF
jgi:TonB-linked SusC/RagA family outer membrane protein